MPIIFSVLYLRQLVIMFHALQTHLLKYVVYWWCRKCQNCYHLLQKMVEQKTEFYLLLENQISLADDKSSEQQTQLYRIFVQLKMSRLDRVLQFYSSELQSHYSFVTKVNQLILRIILPTENIIRRLPGAT